MGLTGVEKEVVRNLTERQQLLLVLLRHSDAGIEHFLADLSAAGRSLQYELEADLTESGKKTSTRHRKLVMFNEKIRRARLEIVAVG